MKKIKNFLNKHNWLMQTLTAFIMSASFLKKEGCCFYIFHQPKFPDDVDFIEEEKC